MSGGWLPIYRSNDYEEWLDRVQNAVYCSGYDYSYGKYVGCLTMMLAYLKALKHPKWSYYHELLKAHRKASDHLTPTQVEELKWEVVALLPAETQRKFVTMGFMHH